MAQIIINTGTSIAINNDEPDLAEGSAVQFSIGAAGGLAWRCVMRLSLAELPADATLVSASLTLTRDGNATTHRVYRLTEDHTPAETSWNSRALDVPWTTAGGTFAASPFVPIGTGVAPTVDVLELTQAARLAGAATLDLLVLSTDEGEGFPAIPRTYSGFGSANPPTFTVTYEPGTSFQGNHGAHWRPGNRSVQGVHGVHWVGWD